MSFTEINLAFVLPDDVWKRIKVAISLEPPKPKDGRPKMDNRKALNGICCVLRTGCQWNALPRCLGISSTVHDRFQLWVEHEVFERMCELGLEQYAQSNLWDPLRSAGVTPLPHYYGSIRLPKQRQASFQFSGCATLTPSTGDCLGSPEFPALPL